MLNPKPGLFVLVFLLQFVVAGWGTVTTQMRVYGAIFATMTTAVFAVLGRFANRLAAWLQGRPGIASVLVLRSRAS